jgi:hypothetical protein
MLDSELDVSFEQGISTASSMQNNLLGFVWLGRRQEIWILGLFRAVGLELGSAFEMSGFRGVSLR